MKSFYINAEIIDELNSMKGGRMSAEYIFSEEEAEDQFFGGVMHTNKAMELISHTQADNIKINFAIVGSRRPFQVTHLRDNIFIVLIDQNAHIQLLMLCCRLQSLPPLAKELSLDEIPQKENYAGKYLIDITKDIIFNKITGEWLPKNEYGFMTFQSAHIFIIGHEIAHIAHGHLDFMQSEDAADFNRDEESAVLTRKTLEMDADRAGTACVIDAFERYLFFMEKDLEVKKIVRKQYISGLIFAILYLDTIASTYSPKFYPTNFTRYILCMSMIEEIFRKHVPEMFGMTESIRQLVVELFIGLSGSIGNLAHPIVSNFTIEHENGNKDYFYHQEFALAHGREELAPMHSRWARLRPFLEKYRRAGKLAPAVAPAM